MPDLNQLLSLRNFLARTKAKKINRGFKAINKHCSKDLQAVVDGYCKFWVLAKKPTKKVLTLTNA